jgi:SAM-dependent methyltransferase
MEETSMRDESDAAGHAPVPASKPMPPPAAEDYGGRVVQMLNDALCGLLVSVGHQTGLFDAMAGMSPASSAEIADAAGLNERYVREWLCALTAAGLVEYRSDPPTFRLPEAGAATLTRAAGPDNLATLFQYIALAGEIEPDLVQCFRNGGGVPYARFRRFQALQAEETARVFDATLLGTTLPLVPGIVDRLTAGIDVGDVGCGQGHALCLMANAFPRSRFVGYDLSQEAVAAGRAEAERLGLRNATFEMRDIEAFGPPPHFDFVTAFDCVHDLAHPARGLRSIFEVLRPDGWLLIAEVAAHRELADNIAHPLAPTLYASSCMHCMPVSLAQGGEGTGCMWGQERVREILLDTGFADVDVRRVPGDIVNAYFIGRKR